MSTTYPRSMLMKVNQIIQNHATNHINVLQQHPMNKLKIISYNAKGLRGNNKRAKVINWANRKNFDIMAIQESHFLEEDRTKWEKNWEGKIISSCGKGNKKGVTFLIRKELNYKLIKEYRDKKGRWLILELEMEDTKYTIATYYGPNKDKIWHLEDMISKVDEIGNSNTLICGDFNFVFNLNIDKLGGRNTTNFKCRKRVIEWMQEQNLVDIWRIKNPNLRKYTWTSNHRPPIKCRLDFFLISESLSVKYKHCDIVPGMRSDHDCITLTLEDRDTTRGKGTWKFNSSLLQDDTFKREIVNTIESVATDNRGTEERLLWDTIKCCLRGKCIGYAINKRKQERRLLQETTKVIQNLENEQCDAIRSNADLDEITRLTAEIKEHKKIIENKVEEDTKASAIRSRSMWYEQGDTSSKLFLNLEKSRGDQKAINRLKNNQGDIITDRAEIMKEEERYYKELYSSKVNECQRETDDIFNTISPKLEVEDHEQLVKVIEEDEVWEIIKESPKNKSPGMDGFTNEFYQAFWPQVKKYMLEAFNASLEKGELSITQKRGVITLIPKPQKDLDLLKNWRPITLLNHDYKYLAKVIANRCKALLPKIINSDQTGFVPGRYIGCNIQRIQSLIERCEEESINGVLLSIDFEKAFDSVEWKFVYKALKYFNFPDKYIEWIKCFYKDIKTCIINNGHMSKFFTPERGVRQGCPLSPYLFVIAAEILSLYIKQHPNVRGIKPSIDEDYTLSQFADDTSIALIASKQNINNIIQILNKFSTVSGLKINVDKTELLLLGKTTPESIPKRYRNLITEEIKILGLVLRKDTKETTELNYNAALTEMVKATDLWKKRPMSLAGKICIIKTMITSKLLYCINNLASPQEDYWKEIETILYSFLNDGKNDKIRRNTLIGPYEKGGYKMLDIRSQNDAMKMNWGKRLITNEGVWKSHMTNKIPTDVKYLLRCNLKYEDLPFKLRKGSIWEEFWSKWCRLNFKENIQGLEEVMNQNLWFNSKIKIQNKIVHYKRWEEKGIAWLNQLIVEDLHGRLKFISHEELERNLTMRIPIMSYYSLRDAIPNEWKRTINSNIEIEEDEDYKLIDRLLDNKQATKLLYTSLVDNKSSTPDNALEKWTIDLNKYNIDAKKEILITHFNQRKGIINNKIKSFNYKFMLRVIPTGRRLYLMGIEDSPNCQQCNVIENIVHLYWQCPHSKRLWERLKFIIETEIKIVFPLSKERCLLGTGPLISRSKKDEIQLLCNWTKHYIHLNKCNKGTRSPIGLESYIKSNMRTEKQIYMEKGWGNLYHEKWNDLVNWSEN